MSACSLPAAARPRGVSALALVTVRALRTRDLFRRAAGSASELTTALRIAKARGYITAADFGAVEAALDRVRAMLWRLTH